MHGTVSKVTDHTFTLRSGNGRVVVDVSTLGYNPLDNKGTQKIRRGNVVRVDGLINDGFFMDNLLQATAVVTLLKNTKVESSTKSKVEKTDAAS